MKENKETHIQIRVSPSQKAVISRSAKKAGMGMSQWILSMALPAQRQKFEQMVERLGTHPESKYVLAEIHDLLRELTVDEFQQVVSLPPRPAFDPPLAGFGGSRAGLADYGGNYLAAMIEYAAFQKGVCAPAWVKHIRPLPKPVFGVDLQSLRLHLLFSSPPCFRNRNIFIDSTIGARV
ncbi:MAG: hypothetical protein HY209_02500 [Candidatus Omnitrophica bacterium]|nr:hypothetical protein [Candidatus Omnitrophota bacterium]